MVPLKFFKPSGEFVTSFLFAGFVNNNRHFPLLVLFFPLNFFLSVWGTLFLLHIKATGI